MNNKSLQINKQSKLKNYIPKDQLKKKLEEQKSDNADGIENKQEEERAGTTRQIKEKKSQANKDMGKKITKSKSKEYLNDISKSYIDNTMEVIEEEK